MTVQPLLIVEAPPIQPYRYGLESVAVPAPTDDPHWQMGVQYEQFATYEPAVWPGACYIAEPTSNASFIPSGAALPQGLPFAVYAGVNCSIVGYTEQMIEDRARAILKLGWQYAAEQALWAGTGSTAPALTSAGTTIATGASTVSALSQLEDYLGSHYNGVGIIHAPRKMGAYLADRKQIFERGNSQLQTALGNQFVFGGGYANTGPGNTSAPANTAWMYATGLVTVRRGEVFVPADLGAALNRTTNVQNMLAQQLCVLTVDGPTVAISVDLTK